MEHRYPILIVLPATILQQVWFHLSIPNLF
jgi:hypothetical protein